MLDDMDQMCVSVLSSRVYPTSEGTSEDRLCCCQADGDQSLRDTGRRTGAAILKPNCLLLSNGELTNKSHRQVLSIFGLLWSWLRRCWK